MIKRILPVFLCASLSLSASALDPDKLLHGPSNDDPRVIGLMVVGLGAAACGLWMVKNGLDKFSTGVSGSGDKQKELGVFSRMLAGWTALFGANLTIAGASLVIGCKDLITEWNKACAEGRWDRMTS